MYEADEVIPENSPLEENYSQRQISVEVISFTQNADTISIKAITKDRDKRERVFFLQDLLPNMIHYRKLIFEYAEWHELYVETFLDL